MQRAVGLTLLAVLGITGPSWSGDGVVALQTAAPSCADESGKIYVDCGNGTVTDNRSGLVWLKNASCFDGLGWIDAVSAVAGLADISGGSVADAAGCGLTDGSSPGEWRLATTAEWEAMFSPAGLGCDPAISDDSGSVCWSPACAAAGQCAFTGVQSTPEYWSATHSVEYADSAWSVSLDLPEIWLSSKGNSYLVWPVRGGQ